MNRGTFILLAALCSPGPSNLLAQVVRRNCTSLLPGTTVPEPEDLRSRNGQLAVDLTVHSELESGGSLRYCYTTPEGLEAPTLRVNPGDLLILNLRNDLTDFGSAGHRHMNPGAKQKRDPCQSGMMSATSTNLHFHGLTIPAVCHQDEVLRTSLQPGEKPFQYRFRIPANEPPGLYWYHPHIHGFSKFRFWAARPAR